MAIIKLESFIDDETGGVLHKREKSIPFSLFNEERGYMLFINRNNVRTFPSVEFPEGISKTDMGNLYLLSRYIYSTTNMLGYRSNKSVKPMNMEQMGEIIGLCDKRAKTWLNRMLKLGLIAKVRIQVEDNETIQYYMNPLYFFSDRYLPLSLYLLFQEQIDKHIPEWVRQKYRELQDETESDNEKHGD